MKAIWVDARNGLDVVKAKANRFTAAYFALDGPADELQRNMLDARNAGFAVGVYVASNWDQYRTLTGYEFGEAVHADLDFIKYPKPSWPKVQFDIENHDPDYVVETLSRFRELRPTTDLSWTLESFQGGWMYPGFADLIAGLKVRVVPQFYRGLMADIEKRDSDPATFWKQVAAEQVAQDMALRNLLRAGFEESRITGFYDAAALPQWWDGFAFTQGRLP